MKIRKYLLILIILLILLNISSIHATDNSTTNINKINDESNLLNVDYNKTTNHELKAETNTTEHTVQRAENQNILTNYYDTTNGAAYNAQLTLTINDTDKNATLNLHVEWDLLMSQEHYNKCQIQIHENNTIIQTININETNNSYSHNLHQTIDIPLSYNIKDKTEIKATLLQINSNILSFEKQKNITLTHLKNNTILINNSNYSNENWTNTLKYLKKAISEAPQTSIIKLNNIHLLNDENQPITINKNITIIGRNATIDGLEKGTIFIINSQCHVTLINLTFTSTTTNYLIKNNGNLKIINNNFTNNFGRILYNNGDLTLENTIIENTAENHAFLMSKIENTFENGLIYNNKILILKNTTFDNIQLNHLTIENKKINWQGIIINQNKTLIQDSKFTNINNRLIQNNGHLEINNTLIENITSTNIAYTVHYVKQLNNKVMYYSYLKKTNSLEECAIYNNNTLNIINTTFQKIIGCNGAAIYNNATLNITHSKFHNIDGNDGGAIYNNKNLNIFTSTFQTITGTNGGAIYNKDKLTVNDSLFNNTQSKSKFAYGGAIFNMKECIVNNSTITESKISQGYGGGICNNGILTINNTIISKCSGSAVGGVCIHNNGIMTIKNSQIVSNLIAQAYQIMKEMDDGAYSIVTNIYGGAISNSENGKATIERTIIKNNTLVKTLDGAWGYHYYYGTIKNNGILEIKSSIFDNNQPMDWSANGAKGSINIYNTGTLTVMYTYLLNTKTYTGNQYSPFSFLYNTGTSTLNYNFYCLNPISIIQNANPNYYFIPSFEYEYYPIKLNKNKNITLTLALTNGSNTLEFNDWDKLLTLGLNATITTINENGEYSNISLLLKDKYTFNFNYTPVKAIYAIYANILNYKNTAIIDIGKEYPEMTVTYNNITYNDKNNITFHVKITGNTTPTGNITLTYNSKKVTLNLTDGKCNFTITETLKPSNYTMRIDYNGDDDYFRVINQYYPFTVHKIPTNIAITAKKIKVDQKGEITITVAPDTAMLKGYLYLTKGDKVRKFLADTQGLRTLYPKNFEDGVWNATVIFEEDEYYLGGSASTIFIVSRYTTNLTITSRDVKAGEANATLNITITPGDVRGEAILKINGVNKTIFINNTMTPVTLTDLQQGTYTVNIYYPGDAKYAPSNATTTFSVARITSHLTVDITYNENLTGNIHIKTNYKNCTGQIGIYINNDLTILNLTNGEINTPVKFKRGTNYIYIHYNGDSYYSISNWSTTKFLDGKPQMTLETTTLLSNQEGYIRIILKDIGQNPYEYTDIIFEFNNQTMTLKTDENGTAYYKVQVSAGTYTVKATYNTTTVTKTVTVKVPVKITVQIPNISQDDDLVVYATLTCDEKINDYIILEINGQYYKVIITNGAGSRNLGEFKTGTYTFNAIYPGTQLLTYTNTTGTFNVASNNYRITGNKNINAYYGANKNYKIQLLNNNKAVKDAIITIKINKNTVKVKTDNQGYATLKLSLKAGKYTITSTYKNVKVSNKIVIKPTLITKNKKIKKGKTLTYTSKLLNKNGKKLKNKKITFKINGKKYKAKTNKKGIAKIKVKNLKKGKYKIKTTYGKLKNTNTITVK